MLVGRPVKIIAAYLSPSRPIIGSERSACFRVGLPVLLAADLNAKHVNWNSRLSMRREKFLRDYTDENSCLIFGPDTPTINPYNPSATPDVLDIVLTKELPSLMYLTLYHLQVIIDIMCRSSFLDPPDGPDFSRTYWTNFQARLEDEIPINPELKNGVAINTCVENLSGVVLKDLTASTPKSRPCDGPR
jgi:hypothetical protein